MQIDDTANEHELSHAGLRLTEEETRELRDTLDILLADPGARHEHVASADFKVGLTISLDR